MSSYRQIYTNFWTDNYIMDLDSQEKLLFIYLLTSNRSSQCGIFEFNLRDACLVTGLKAKKISMVLGKLHKDKKILYEKANGEIMLVNWLKYNALWKSCKTRKHVNKELQCVKSEALLDLFYDQCLEKCKGNVEAMVELFGGMKHLQQKLSLLAAPQETPSPHGEGSDAGTSPNDSSSECPAEAAPEGSSETGESSGAPLEPSPEKATEPAADEAASAASDSPKGITCGVTEYEVFNAYEHTFGHYPTLDEKDPIYQLIAKHGTSWVKQALQVGFTHEAKSMSYIASILANWKRDGKVRIGSI